MSLKRIIEKSDIDKANIPSSYQILGDIMLIKFKPKIKHEIKEKVARAILNKIHNIKTVCEIKKWSVNSDNQKQVFWPVTGVL